MVSTVSDVLAEDIIDTFSLYFVYLIPTNIKYYKSVSAPTDVIINISNINRNKNVCFFSPNKTLIVRLSYGKYRYTQIYLDRYNYWHF